MTHELLVFVHDDFLLFLFDIFLQYYWLCLTGSLQKTPQNKTRKTELLSDICVYTSTHHSDYYIKSPDFSGDNQSCTVACHLQPRPTWLLSTGRRLGLLPPDTLPWSPLWSSPGALSRSARSDSGRCCNNTIMLICCESVLGFILVKSSCKNAEYVMQNSIMYVLTFYWNLCTRARLWLLEALTSWLAQEDCQVAKKKRTIEHCNLT